MQAAEFVRPPIKNGFMLRKLILSITVLSLSFLALAQQRQVTGVVIDENGAPIVGATVLVEETRAGTTSGVDGRFTIAVPEKATLSVSFIGYASQQVAVAGRNKLEIILKEDSEAIENVVVVGYGSGQKVGNIVGSVVTISAAELSERPTANVGDALQGKVPGLQIFNTSGEPDGSVSVKLRGTSSFNLTTEPLYILDGVPVQPSVFTQINPQDIENISVLKDASSTAIYGSRAANGVIYITTKKGKKGDKPRVSLRAQYGISMLTHFNLDMMNAEELFRFEELCRPELADNPIRQAKKAFVLGNGIDFDWTDYLFDKSAPLVQADASIRGATENTTYYASLGYYSEQGTSKANSNLRRFSFRTNLDTQITKWLKFGANVALTYSQSHKIETGWLANSPMLMAMTAQPYNVPYEYTYNDDGTVGYGDVMWRYPWSNIVQPDLNVYYDKNPNDLQRLNLMGQTFFTISPVKGLTIRAAQAVEGFDYTNSTMAPVSFKNYSGVTPYRQESFQRYYQLSSTNTIEYRTNFNARHFLTALVGHESYIKVNRGFNASGEGYSDDRLFTLSNASQIVGWGGFQTEASYNSFFANVNYNFDGKYFVDASVRTDGSSSFGANHRYAVFYSVGAMWKLKQEKFLQNVSWVNDLNVTLSYGTTGNAGLFTPYSHLGLVGGNGTYNGIPGWGIAQVANPDLTWETVGQLNVGVNGRLASRVSFNAQFYNRQSKDLIMSIPFSASTGHSSGYGNVASMRNRGFDLELTVDLLHTKDIYWTVSGNVNYNKNTITKLYQGLNELAFPNSGTKYEVGRSMSEVWVPIRVGVDPDDGSPMWYDQNGNLTKTYSDDLFQFTGMDSTAPWSGGFSMNFSWKGLGLAADFSWVGERWIFIDERYYTVNPTDCLQLGNFERKMLNIWTTPGQKTDIPKYGTPYRADTSLYSNASFMRLKNLSLSYTFPREWITKSGFISGLRVYVTGRNIWTVTGFDGYDPEVGYTNATSGMYPNSQQYVFGAELTF